MQQPPPPPFGQQANQWAPQGYDGGYGMGQQPRGPGQFPTPQPSAQAHGNYHQPHAPGIPPQQHPQQPMPMGVSGDPHGPNLAAGDPLSGMLATGVASGALQSAYGNFQKGQQYFQSKMGIFSGGAMYHLFAVTTDYVRAKLFLLLTPYMKKWNYARHPEQVAGGQRYLSPRQDTNAPDLYIPAMSLCTYCILSSSMRAVDGTFQPEGMYNTAWYATLTWLVQFAILKTVLYMLGIASYVPWLELLAYSGYMFFPLCITVLSGALGGTYVYYFFWVYGSMCTAVFLVRTMKRIIFHEVQQYGVDRTMHNYLLLGVAVAQFPLALWLGHV